MRKKRIAVLIDWYLPGNKAGGPVRSVYSMISLLKNEFDFYIITTNRDLGTDPYQNIEADTWLTHEGVPVYYFSREQMNENNLLQVLDKCQADIIYLNSFWSYYFSILPLRLKKKGKINGKIILAPRGMLGHGALNIKPLKKRLFLFVSKLSGLYKNVLFHASTVSEEKEIRSQFPSAKIQVASNINVTPPVKNKIIQKEVDELKLFFLSRVVPIKNLHGALEVLAGLKTDGKITYDIYGSLEDHVYWKECEGRLKKLPSNIKVNYKGELDFDKVHQTISSYHYLFLLTLNENFGHSIAESLLCASPVIISDCTPWTDVNQNNCGIALDPANTEGFRAYIAKALKLDKLAYSEISQNCITFTDTRINPDQNKKEHRQLFE